MKILIMILLLIPSLSYASTTAKLGEGKTEFLAVGNPGFLKINGAGSGPEGEIDIKEGKLNADISVDLKSLDTGMSLRNKHMKEKYLKVAEFPKAKLVIKDYKLPTTWSFTEPTLKDLKIPGTLTIHGQSQHVETTTSISKAGGIDSSFEIKITDFKIDIPSFMGVTVADSVKVDITSNLVQTEKDSVLR